MTNLSLMSKKNQGTLYHFYSTINVLPDISKNRLKKASILDLAMRKARSFHIPQVLIGCTDSFCRNVGVGQIAFQSVPFGILPNLVVIDGHSGIAIQVQELVITRLLLHKFRFGNFYSIKIVLWLDINDIYL